MITIDNFIGNEDFMKVLRISLIAAKETNSALPHILIKGPAGTGKTTLAEAVAEEFGTKTLALTPTTAKNTSELRKLFHKMPGEGYDQEGNVIGEIRPQIVFSDECHQLPLVAQENLGIAMQDWRLPVRVGGKDVFEWVPRFTLIGATTLPGRLSKPFADRFEIQSEFETYTLEESVEIANLQAKVLGISLKDGVADAVARRSRGVARLIVRFLKRLRDAAVVAGRDKPEYRNIISIDLTRVVFRDFLRIDDRGLTKTDIKLLKLLAKTEEPVGLDSLSTFANEDKSTLSKAVEPFLIQEGLLLITKRGRIITDQGRRYLESAGYIGAGTSDALEGRIIGAATRE